jgi:hypothetical protein
MVPPEVDRPLQCSRVSNLATGSDKLTGPGQAYRQGHVQGQAQSQLVQALYAQADQTHDLERTVTDSPRSNVMSMA